MEEDKIVLTGRVPVGGGGYLIKEKLPRGGVRFFRKHNRVCKQTTKGWGFGKGQFSEKILGISSKQTGNNSP